MKKVQKGFTLVELIVVITILAILATIAFISLQGYSQDAKNSKVDADLRTIVTAVETSLTDGTLSSIWSVGDNTLWTASKNIVDTTTAGQTFGPLDTGATTASGATYKVGLVNFVGLKQNGTDFKDSNGKDYIISSIINGDEAYYQVAGQTLNADGTYKAVVKGNYISSVTSLAGLISDSSASKVPVAGSGSMQTGLY